VSVERATAAVAVEKDVSLFDVLITSSDTANKNAN